MLPTPSKTDGSVGVTIFRLFENTWKKNNELRSRLLLAEGGRLCLKRAWSFVCAYFHINARLGGITSDLSSIEVDRSIVCNCSRPTSLSFFHEDTCTRVGQPYQNNRLAQSLPVDYEYRGWKQRRCDIRFRVVARLSAIISILCEKQQAALFLSSDKVTLFEVYSSQVFLRHAEHAGATFRVDTYLGHRNNIRHF